MHYEGGLVGPPGWLADHGHELNRVARNGVLDRGVCHGDRASSGRDGLPGSGRDGLPGSDRAFAGDRVCHQGRAGNGRDCEKGDSRAFANDGGVCHRDRASSGRDEVYGDSRAWARSGDLCPGDRAFWHRDQECHGDRPGADQPGDQGGNGTLGGIGGKRGRVEDGAEEEQLKSIPVVLPLLPVPHGQDASLAAGDWIVQIRPLLGDLAPHALQWWDCLMEKTMEQYKKWLCASPLELAMYCQGRPRLEMRITSLLLAALPKGLKEELIAARQLNVGAENISTRRVG